MRHETLKTWTKNSNMECDEDTDGDTPADDSARVTTIGNPKQ